MSGETLPLAGLGAGDPKSNEGLLMLVYNELRLLAHSKLVREAPGQTLQPTALVHEAWLRLVSSGNPSFENRAHFFGAAAEAMRRILIERARRKHAVRHGGEWVREDFDGREFAVQGPEDRILAVNDALEKLAITYPMQAELVKLRYFVGLTNQEAAELLGISAPTAQKYWTFARSWLFDAIRQP